MYSWERQAVADPAGPAADPARRWQDPTTASLNRETSTNG